MARSKASALDALKKLRDEKVKVLRAARPVIAAASEIVKPSLEVVYDAV